VGLAAEQPKATTSKAEAKLVESMPYASGLWSHTPLLSVASRKLPQTPLLMSTKLSSIVPSSAESPVTPFVSDERVNTSVPPVPIESLTADPVQRTDVVTLLPVSAADHMTSEVIPTTMSLVAMFTTPVLNGTVAHTRGLTEYQSGPIHYPVLGSTRPHLL